MATEKMAQNMNLVKRAGPGEHLHRKKGARRALRLTPTALLYGNFIRTRLAAPRRAQHHTSPTSCMGGTHGKGSDAVVEGKEKTEGGQGQTEAAFGVQAGTDGQRFGRAQRAEEGLAPERSIGGMVFALAGWLAEPLLISTQVSSST